MGDIWPDLVVLLTIPADVTAERMRRRQLDRFEQAGDDFHARVERGFAAMAEAEPERWVGRRRHAVEGRRRGRDPRRRRGAAGTVSAATASIWDAVVGQPVAVERLTRAAAAPVHAYLFVGPAGLDQEGGGARLRGAAARLRRPGASATPNWRCAASIPTCTRWRVSAPSITVRAGARDRAARIAGPDRGRSQGDDPRRVPPASRPRARRSCSRRSRSRRRRRRSSILADFVPHDLITISSRCARDRVPDDPGAATSSSGCARKASPTDAAREAAASAGGSIERARVLASDPDLADRRRAFADGATPARRHRRDRDADRRRSAGAHRGRGRRRSPNARRPRSPSSTSGSPATASVAAASKTLEDRHKRELRRHRTDELLAGLTVIAGSYRDAMVAGTAGDPTQVAAGVTRDPRRDGGVRAQPQRIADAAGPTVVASRAVQRVPPLGCHGSTEQV